MSWPLADWSAESKFAPIGGDLLETARMAFSMMRDLIRLDAPHLENPGALQRLVKEIEEGEKNQSER